jgi:HSP20 family molecular chaperone IbpA
MWVNALKMLEQADELQRQYFRPLKSDQSGPSWEPPVDIFETDEEVLILVALPGVCQEHIQITIEGDLVAIIGERPLTAKHNSLIRRMEIPYGRFERHVKLKDCQVEIRENTLDNGCLKLVLKKTDTGES